MKSELYSQYAEQYDAAVQDNIYNACLERPSLQAMLGKLKGLDVVDLGCGSGVYAKYLLSKQVKSLTCIDFSEAMVKLVRSKFSEQVSAYVQDLSQGLPLQKSMTVDVIVCPLLLHYIEDLTTIFKDIQRVLRPGGYMVLSTHHPFADFECSRSGNYFEKERVQQEWHTIGKPVTVSFYRRSLTEICNAITENGLVISQISEGEVSVEAKAKSVKTYEMLRKQPNFIFIKCSKP